MRIKLAQLFIDELFFLLSCGKDSLLKFLLLFLKLLLKILVCLDLDSVLKALGNLSVVLVEFGKLLVQDFHLLLSTGIDLLVKLLAKFHNLFLHLLILLSFDRLLESLGDLVVVSTELAKLLVKIFFSLHGALDELGLDFLVLLVESLLFSELSEFD